jgi:hypothetical protein
LFAASDVSTACDTVAAILADTPGTVTRPPAPRDDSGNVRCRVLLRARVAGYGGGPRPEHRLWQGLLAHGWREDPQYAADGPDGTVFALRNQAALCIANGRWDGGDDSDPTYVPDDRYELSVKCTANAAAGGDEQQ